MMNTEVKLYNHYLLLSLKVPYAAKFTLPVVSGM